MDYFVQFVFEALFEIVFQVVGQILLEAGWSRAKVSRKRVNHQPVPAGTGLFGLGVAVGLLWMWVHPGRLLTAAPLPGASLLLAPILGGAAMYFWGTYRRRHGVDTTSLATWWGGASFSFAVALVRFLGTG